MKIHFIAIGGSVMHQLAIMMKLDGHEVTGSDDEIFDPALSNLKKYGLINDNYFWNEDIINKNIDCIILGMHATIDNVELIKAQKLNIPIFSYPEYIYENCKNKMRIVVTGSHGKTSTTSILIHILKKLKKQFDYLVGAKPVGLDFSVSIKNNSKFLIAEGDEYLASKLKPIPKFLFYKPHITIITGIAWDHINVFPTFEKYLQQFKNYLNTIEKNGTVIYNTTDNILKHIVEQNSRHDIKKIPYKVPDNLIDEEGNQILIINQQSQKINVFGEHNLLNIASAFEVCTILDISSSDFLLALSSFNGVEKRLELIEDNKDFKIYKDFAHSPSKLKATIKAIKAKYKNKNIVCVYELHTFSSLNAQFLKEYKKCFLDIAEPIVYLSSHALALKKMQIIKDQNILDGFTHKAIKICRHKEELKSELKNRKKTNTIFLLMSSGNFDGLDLKNIF